MVRAVFLELPILRQPQNPSIKNIFPKKVFALLYGSIIILSSVAADINIKPNSIHTMTTLPSHAVRARRFFYGPQEKTSIAFVGSIHECRKFIERDAAEIYHLSHNESGRWNLRIVRTNTLSNSAAADAAYRLECQSFEN